MKKLVALLLGVSMILSLAACTSKETTKKKSGKKPKKTTTEETTEEPTEDSSDDPTEKPTDPAPTDTSETDPSESDTTEPSDTSSAPAEVKIEFRHDLVPEKMGKSHVSIMYGAVDPNADDEYSVRLSEISIEYDNMYTLEDNSDTRIKNILADSEWHEEENCWNLYDDYIDLFKEAEKNGDPLFNVYVAHKENYLRADSQIFSFYFESSAYSEIDELVGGAAYHSYDSQTGEEIYLEDILADEDAFETYFQTYMQGTDVNIYKELELMETRFYSIGMSYDSIFIGGEKLPVLGCPEAFKMEYFLSTPPSYSLLVDRDHYLGWDFNNDGGLDDLYFETVGSGKTEAIRIILNDNEFEFTKDDLPDLEYTYDTAFNSPCVDICVEGNHYLVISMQEEDDLVHLYVFRLGDNRVEFVEQYYGFLEDYFDCENLIISGRVDCMGTLFLDYSCAMDKDGKITRVSDLARCYAGPYEVKVDLSAQIYDFSDNALHGAYTLKAGTKVEVLGYDDEREHVIVRTLTGDMEESEDFALEADGSYKVGGYYQDDAFIGLNHAG